MKAGSFILNGVYSEYINTVIQSRPMLDTPKRKVSFKSSFGESGDIPYDDNAYENTQLSLTMYTNGKNSTKDREQLYLMFDSSDYIDLILYNDPTKIYKVMVTEPPKFEQRFYYDEGMSYEVSFTVKPYKMLINSSPQVFTTSGGVIINPSKWASLPIIKVNGSGAIDLSVNGKIFAMKNIVDTITIDSKPMVASKLAGTILENQNKNVYTREYPILQPDKNIITWTGSVSRVEIIPEWRTLV